jgi:hypothetical protein
MNDEININEWIRNFDNYKYSDPDVSVQCEAGWYDWFCNNRSLASKTKMLGKRLKQIAKSPKVNCETSYVFFKNNCPLNGPLYDDFRICDIKTGDVIWTITPRSGHTGKAEVWGKENDFKEAIVQGSWKDVKEYFNV